MLSGTAVTEYTEATTGQLISPVTKDWDMELIERLGYPKRIFRKVVTPGTEIGHLTEEVQREVGFDCKVVVPAAHDTGSGDCGANGQRQCTVYQFGHLVPYGYGAAGGRLLAGEQGQ